MTIYSIAGKVPEPILKGATEVYEVASKSVHWLHRKIEYLAHKALPPKAARVALHIAEALPLAVAWMLIPPVVRLGVLASYYICKLTCNVKLSSAAKLTLTYGGLIVCAKESIACFSQAASAPSPNLFWWCGVFLAFFASQCLLSIIHLEGTLGNASSQSTR